MPLPSHEMLDDFLSQQRQEVKAALMQFCIELDAGEKKHPRWPTDIVHRAAIVGEEAGEMLQAAVNTTYENTYHGEVIKECVQTGAMCLRFLTEYESLTVNPSL